VRPRLVRSLGILALLFVAFPVVGAGQSQMHPRWEIPGLDFRPDGAWRAKARRVAAVRKQLVASRNFSALNGPIAMARVQAQGGDIRPSFTAAVSGTHTVPALLFSYKNTDSSLFMRAPSQYAQLLFGATPLTGTPYSVRTFYEEMSNSLLSMQGQTLGWVRLDSNEVFYTGAPGTCNQNPFGTTNCNGIFSAAATAAMQNGMRKALANVDTGAAGINWGQFDNDGADGTPNSGDDDGYVDMLMFAHATRDGACGGSTNNHIWSHRFFFVNSASTNFQDFVTNDASAEGGTIRISDYFVASGLGGPGTGCDSTQIMPIGTAAHEFGHALGLPDLYDTQGPTEGIGQWGLMGSGNFASPQSPARFEAWSLTEMGWVTLAPLTTTNTYRFGAAPASDTAFFVNVQGANPRGEYFLLENRQASFADTALIRLHCLRSGNPPGCGGGMLIWHVDQAQIDAHGFRAGNTVNVGPIHGLHLEQGDGLNQLDDPSATFPRRRGDAGDPYPGVSANTAFAPRTNPSAKKNVDGSFIGFAIDSIRQVVAGGEMAFRLRFGAVTVVRGSDTAATVLVDGESFKVFRDLLDNGSSHTVSIADTQLSASGRTRFRFASWSDGGARTHTITGALAGDTVIATLNRDFKLIATTSGTGTITPDTAIDLAGTFISSGRSVQLTATATGGTSFVGWSGDTISSNPVITLPMGRPYTVTANFLGSMTTAEVVAQLLGPTAPLSSAQIQYLDSQGNNNGVFDIGDFLAWVKSTGAPLRAAVLERLAAVKGVRP
jgi:M6 family metalloprotease-like protein